jgi:hypothetical protein
MKAMSVIPGRLRSGQTAELPDPSRTEGSVLAEGLTPRFSPATW